DDNIGRSLFWTGTCKLVKPMSFRCDDDSCYITYAFDSPSLALGRCTRAAITNQSSRRRHVRANIAIHLWSPGTGRIRRIAGANLTGSPAGNTIAIPVLHRPAQRTPVWSVGTVARGRR